MARAGYHAGGSTDPFAGSFQYGSIPFPASYGSSAGRSAAQIAKPGMKDVALSALTGLQGSIDAAKQLRTNPLGDPGAAAALSGIQQTLNRQQAAGIGAAKGRAAASGQGFSNGALAGTAARLQQGNADAYANASAELAAKMAEQGRLQETELTKAQLQGELEAQKNSLEKYGIDATLAAKQAELSQHASEFGANNAIDQAKLAEGARQFGISTATQQHQFGLTREQDQNQFDARLNQSNSQFERTNSLQAKQLEMQQREQDFQKAKDILSATSGAYGAGLAGQGDVAGALQGVTGKLPSAKRPSALHQFGAGTGSGTGRPGRLF